MQEDTAIPFVRRDSLCYQSRVDYAIIVGPCIMNIIRGNNTITRAVRLAFFALAIMYVAGMLCTAIHEVLGHGLSAVLLGGQFSGFTVKWDGMGWAFADLPTGGTPAAYQILFWASGIIATTVCGTILWGLVFFFRRRPDIQLALLVGSFILLINGIDYILWNSYHPVLQGDIGRIILFSQVLEFPGSTVLRWILLIAGVLLFAGTVFYFCTSIFIRTEALILSGGQFTGKSRLLALFLFLALPGAYEFLSFDWNQVAPGIGRIPNMAGALSIITVAAVLFWYRPRLKNVNSVPLITLRHLVISGTCLLVTVTALALWLNDGVRWQVSKEKDTPKIGGPFAINSSGDLLFCVVNKGSVGQPYIIPLRNRLSQPIALQFPGSDSCFGATWRSGAGHDELLFVTGHRPQTIKRFRVTDANVSEISSYKVDPNLFVISWGSNRDILALRVSKLVEDISSDVYLGFFKDNSQSISITEILVPTYLLWIDHCSFYMAHNNMEDGRGIMSKAQLDVDSMTLQTREILQEDEILLATQSLNGSLVYVMGHRLFRDNEILALLPEGSSMRPFVDGSYLAYVSKDRRKIYILSDKGEILDIKQKSRESMFVGLSAANKCVYLTTKDREKILAYNFVEKSESPVFNAADNPVQAPFVVPSDSEVSSRE